MFSIDAGNDVERFYAAQTCYNFPSTRYQGSKAKIIDWIWSVVKDLPFNRVLDAFGGTGVVSHLFKRMGKEVWYNDNLAFNSMIGKALIENNDVLLDERDVNALLLPQPGIKYPDFIQRRFDGVFYLKEENCWLDQTITNVGRLSNEYKRAIAWFALFQSAIIKRPYNLFHRANLPLRISDVKRNFGNKTTWDGSFDTYFRRFVQEANMAVFNNGTTCRSLCRDVFDISDSEYFDLVYIDPPYLSNRNVGTDYLDYYHFLEGMLDYKNWETRLLTRYKHLPLQGKGKSDWICKDRIILAFERLIQKFSNAILVISYRNDGIPSVEVLENMLKKHKKKILQISYKSHQYVLSNRRSSEILLVAK